MRKISIAVIGGGAAGFFGALAAAEKNPLAQVTLFEKAKQVLSKVRISGGGRCNVTHSCFVPEMLVKNYPRGSKALLGPFHRFQPKDTVAWFQQRQVSLKTEADGRMFPITDSSSTIIECFLAEMHRLNIELKTEHALEQIERVESGFRLTFSKGQVFECERLLITTGSSTRVWELLKEMGHEMELPVPSLFSFNLKPFDLQDFAGMSFPVVEARLDQSRFCSQGPMVITHWGFSGPAILKLSAWQARELFACQYQTTLWLNWIAHLNREAFDQRIQQMKQEAAQRLVSSENPFSLPKALWKKWAQDLALDQKKWISLSKADSEKIFQKLTKDAYPIVGKTVNKEEFVTCGGVKLDQVNFKTMESKHVPHLYFAGEVLNIDGVTGGFNFQNAWTTAWIAGNAMAE